MAPADMYKAFYQEPNYLKIHKLESIKSGNFPEALSCCTGLSSMNMSNANSLQW